ncbi:MAG: HDIG domain-containing protein, partial [candidate division Zixibacteria bacterium]|nr:HDIG domain-containing protein [candidate division Zixibacteria bacterium]
VVVFSEKLSSNFPFVSSGALRESYAEKSLWKAHDRIARILSEKIYYTGTLQSLSALDEYLGRPIVVNISGRQTLLAPEAVMDIATARSALLEALNKISRDELINVELHYELGRHFIISNLKLNHHEMAARESAAYSSISLVKDRAAEGDLVVRAGSVVDEKQAALLEEYTEYVKRVSYDESLLQAYKPVVLRLCLVATIFALLFLYLKVFREDIFDSNPKLLATLLIFGLNLVMIQGLEILSTELSGQRWNLSVYLYPVALAPILLGVLFGTRFGVVSSFFSAILIGSLHRFSFELTLFCVFAGSVGAYSVAGVRQRTSFYRTILYLAGVSTALALILGSLRLDASVDFMHDIYYGLAGAALTPILALGFLPLFESLFGFTTDITLLELSDLNRPLLRRLALESPGTYHHSIMVGALSESAARSIGANSLLARVGSYYHDIGKMEIPEYFIENQIGLKSKHDQLTPTMSAIILASHVKKGRQTGEEADLPDAVLNFIDEHHGTMVMSFFYDKALKQGASPDVESEFRYPGPRPQTKETAVVMLADSVEAASRTLEDPTPARVDSLIQKIIDSRYHSGELEECNLTLADLAKIRKSFAQIINGVFHQRIRYPSTGAAAVARV